MDSKDERIVHCIVMTPSLAKAILNASPQLARPVNWRRVAIMANEMRRPRGRSIDDVPHAWPVELDRNGHLVDGRQVLLALVLADVATPVRLESGCEPNPFTHYPPYAQGGA